MNRRPVAYAGANQRVIKGGVVTLDGRGSVDPDRDPIRYRWAVTARPRASRAAISNPGLPCTSFSADREGQYRIQLVVSDGRLLSRPSTTVVSAVYGQLSNPVSPDDFQTIATHGASYLAQNSAGKKLLYLEGGAYERGFAEGSLCGEAVYRMTHDFVQNLVFEFLERMGMDLRFLRADPILWPLLWQVLQLAVASNQDALPEEFLQEMMGMSDACRQRGYDVSLVDIMTLNVGFDSLESISMGFGALFCNEFSVFNKATGDGRLYHGRDFMFFTGGDVFSDEAMLIVHKPDTGYPFAASAAPGFVGIPTGLNSQGVSCGMDVVFSFFTRPLIVGEGCLLLCRKAVQYGGSLDEAVSLIRDVDRAVPWLYMVADGKRPDADVLETVASSALPSQNSINAFYNRLWTGLLAIFFPWLSQQPQNAAGGGTNAAGGTKAGSATTGNRTAAKAAASAPEMDKGVMVRASDYLDPDWLTGLGGLLPSQLESYPDLVAMTNHYIIPWLAITYPSLGGQVKDSLSRYKTMMGLLDEGYSRIDRERAMWIIDFLNPARCDYYGTDITQSVKGHHVLMDNKSIEMWSLHGYYDDPWVHVDLNEILSGGAP